ncbi:chemotaxis protein CheW [Brevundimonas sp.]|uniref:chemotaxis protein CheW n=1 Tax=Brevundimonas sp. TaxID=1871086 RepID=UPI00286CE447|nr:chemotaxis protein CheW [Brevundimonas sp.]
MLELISFEIGGQEYCIDVRSVREIRGWNQTTPMPKTPDYILGLINLRGAGCSGGCLDTLDLLSKLPNMRIAGSTTATGTIFIESTAARLPSNYSDLSYGHKAWTSRERPNNAPSTPAQGLVYVGNPADENAVRTWVGTLFQ